MGRRWDPVVWGLLALPALWWLGEAAGVAAPEDLEELLGPTGEWSARALIAALAVTPLTHVLPGSALVAWLRRQRRALGLAAFGYALLHLVFYLVAMGTVEAVLAELGARGIWTGWAAFGLMAPLAATSSDRAMRAMGRGWKRLQRLAYPAAVLTLVHWVAVHDGLTEALLHVVPLVLLQAYRIYREAASRRPRHLKGRPV